jgi:glycosyltransferase involved in cell wall biosynthesis
MVVCCSEADARHFIAQERTVMVVPNGCDIPVGQPAKHRTRSSTPRVGFLGSSHTPNAVAARYIAEKIAPVFPGVQFEFIGGACDAVAAAATKNIVLHGILSENAKSDIMYEWDLALNPIEAGGGSSLKLSDFMAHGLPTLSTAVGARSFDVEAYDAGRVAPLAEFPMHLREMLEDRDRLRAMGENARRYAEEALDWNVIADEYYAELATSFSPPSKARPRRLLVVTYRYTEPPRGGAEEYLIEVIKRLRPRFDVIDLAAVDVEHITNRHHFGCEVRPSAGASARVGDLFDHSHYFESEEPPESELIARCREIERAWSQEDFDLFRPFVSELAATDKLRLLCGFFSVEVHGGATRRWTAPRFSFLLPAGAAVFRMTGWGAIEKRLKARLLDVAPDGSVHHASSIERRIAASADVSLELPPAPGAVHRVLEIEVDEHVAAGDHRPFGILLESAHALVARESAETGGLRPLGHFPADLSEEVSEELRVSRTEDWVAALRDTALSRTRSTDEHFAASRGPHAPAMQEWLAANSLNYDAVLIQGIPFDVIPSSVQTLSRLPNRPHIVTLPHFHGDDRFYYWRAYLEAFEAADCTLLFSDFLADRLGARDKFAVGPGGGVRVDEITNLGAAAKFAEVHKSDKPFFLVLGRKVGSKGYETALRAHQRLRRTRADLELVMIGPDDDGRPVSGEGVHYLGRQPRDVICGALASCLALVTMSKSESFGIVLCEAWLFGKPVIANANCYAFRDLVRDGETGVLVSSAEELVRAMDTLVADPGRRLRMGRAGFKNVVERYSWQSVADALEVVLAPRAVSKSRLAYV